jgi:hypothetical protein
VREIFAPRETPDPGRVFYTIRKEDIHKSVIQTEIGPIHVSEFMGIIQTRDVRKRIYRVPNAGNYWFWHLENQQQYENRIGAVRE